MCPITTYGKIGSTNEKSTEIDEKEVFVDLLNYCVQHLKEDYSENPCNLCQYQNREK